MGLVMTLGSSDNWSDRNAIVRTKDCGWKVDEATGNRTSYDLAIDRHRADGTTFPFHVYLTASKAGDVAADIDRINSGDIQLKKGWLVLADCGHRNGFNYAHLRVDDGK